MFLFSHVAVCKLCLTLFSVYAVLTLLWFLVACVQ